MNMGKNKTILLIILVLLHSTLFAQITATWVPKQVLQFGPAPSPMDTNKFALHLGTLTINAPRSQLFDPNILHYNFTSAFTFTGPMSWHNDSAGNPVYSDQPSDFRLVAVSTNKNSVEVRNLDQTDGSSRLRFEGGNLNTSSLVVELYILGYQDWIRYKPGALYTLTNGSMVGFGIGVAENGSTYDNRGYAISVNGNSPSTTTPFFAPGNSLSSPVPYGPPVSQVQYLFNITDEQDFNISDAFGSSKAPIARTKLTLNNANSSLDYTFQFIFRNRTLSRFFALQLEGQPQARSIGYALEFNAQRVYGNEPIEWTVRGNTMHVQDILVTQINRFEAENALSGTYRDTITVEIIPPDTI